MKGAIAKKVVIGAIKVANNGDIKAVDNLANTVDNKLTDIHNKNIKKKKDNLSRMIRDITTKESKISSDLNELISEFRKNVLECRLIIKDIQDNYNGFTTNVIYKTSSKIVDMGLPDVKYFSYKNIVDTNFNKIKFKYSNYVKTIKDIERDIINLSNDKKQLDKDIEKLNKEIEEL